MGTSTIPGNQNETSPTVKGRCGSSTRRTLGNLRRTRRRRDLRKRFKRRLFRQHFIHFQFKNVLMLFIAQLFHSLLEQPALFSQSRYRCICLRGNTSFFLDLFQNPIFLSSQALQLRDQRSQVTRPTKPGTLFTLFGRRNSHAKDLRTGAGLTGTHGRKTRRNKVSKFATTVSTVSKTRH
jgi:hypothetical protein